MKFYKTVDRSNFDSFIFYRKLMDGPLRYFWSEMEIIYILPYNKDCNFYHNDDAKNNVIEIILQLNLSVIPMTYGFLAFQLFF